MRALHLTLSFAVSLAVCAVAHAQIVGDKVKIGVLTDLSGAYEAASGAGSVEGARMAAEEFGWKINGKPIEVLAGDHRRKRQRTPIWAPRSPTVGSTSIMSTPSPTLLIHRSHSRCSTSPNRRTKPCC